MKLPKRIKNKWIKALRSGRYKQTDGVLYDLDTKGFCCLGVLQHCTSGGHVEYNEGSRKYFADMPSYLFLKGIGAQLEYVGPGCRVSSSGDDRDLAKLTQMNDDGYSFGDIANYIERKVETL